ncbi:MAG: chemotaxis protein CheA, partial [Gammaproteobacteria bacterium]|nr:chemotaxis protein CheA [Gammaproteobacteria bacterium]
MGFDADEEILQDFLVEAGEILELLSEQLVELEGSPDDMNLLNAIFRGFHTVKGGAGFLQLDELVACCHIAENVFDILRKGERRVTPDLMDVVLEALDSVNEMFQEVRQGLPLTPATDELLAALTVLAQPESAEVEQVAVSADSDDAADIEFDQLLDAIAPTADSAASASDSDMITDDEFEALLDQLHGPANSPSSPVDAQEEMPFEAPSGAVADADQITDDEFEALLDQLHGEGKFNTQANADDAQSDPVATPQPADEPLDPSVISDDEFEALLDELHGKGQFQTSVAQSHAAPEAAPVQSASTATPAASAKPAAQAAPKAAAKPESNYASPERRAVARAPAPEVETTVRVDTARLDDIMNMVGELVLVRNRLVRLGADSGNETMSKVVANLDVVTGDLQAAVMKTRMQPIKKVFGRFPRLVRDMARSLKKQIRLELVGEETDLDKNLVEALADPLVHLVRNSVDHGIESPEDRVAAGKEPEGCVILAASQEGDHIQLTITDDGKGMNADMLRNKAIEKGMLDKEAAERLTDLECYNLIFAAGFSTKTEVSDVSGRGVGMDVVKTKIAQLNGTVNVYSTPGQGSQVVIKVPLTLAIMPTLMVMLANQAFAFPLVNVNEIFHLDLSHTNIVDGQEVIIVRD